MSEKGEGDGKEGNAEDPVERGKASTSTSTSTSASASSSASTVTAEKGEGQGDGKANTEDPVERGQASDTEVIRAASIAISSGIAKASTAITSTNTVTDIRETDTDVKRVRQSTSSFWNNPIWGKGKSKSAQGKRHTTSAGARFPKAFSFNKSSNRAQSMMSSRGARGQRSSLYERAKSYASAKRASSVRFRNSVIDKVRTFRKYLCTRGRDCLLFRIQPSYQAHVFFYLSDGTEQADG